MYHTAAIGCVLAYRLDAPEQLNPEVADGLARIAVAEMEEQKKNPKNKFLSAAAMLMMLLRYRARDPGFLNPDNPHHEPLVRQINEILSQPLPIEVKNRQKLLELFARMRDFIAARGSPLPIFTDLSGLAEDEGADDGN